MANKKTICIIPARAGSKRLPNKNVKNLGGYPLIAWSIEIAKKANCFRDIIVSTDSEYIASVAVEYGATVPYLRKAELANDNASSIDVVIDIISNIDCKEISSVMLLQPTSPFRKVESILEALRIYNEFYESVISVSLKSNIKCINIHHSLSNIGDLLNVDNNMVEINGLIYLSAIENLLQNKSFYSKQTKALVINDQYEQIDIDTQFDWDFAECVVAKHKAFAFDNAK